MARSPSRRRIIRWSFYHTNGGGDENPSKADLKEIDLIRSKLVVNGRVRLDLEALAVYLMVPSYFAIATGLDPEPWQSKFLDSYAQRLGCLRLAAMRKIDHHGAQSVLLRNDQSGHDDADPGADAAAIHRAAAEDRRRDRSSPG